MRFIFILAILIELFTAKSVFAAATISAPTNVPSEVVINQTFSFNSSLTNIQTGETYFIKCRLGSSSSNLVDGQTYNSTTNSWLSDTGAWTDMPAITTSGISVTFPIQCRVKSGSIAEQKVLYSRACLKKSDGTCGTSFQSSSGVNFIADAEPSPSPTASPTPSPSSSSSSSTTSSFTISGVPSTLDSDKSFSASINLSLPNYPNTKFYLKGVFKKPDSSNYFGQTKVNSSWIKNSSTYSDQFSIITDSSGNWSGTIDVQIDSFDSGYTGSGDYIFKVGRYSDSGSGPTWSNEQNIKINAVTIAKEISEIDSADEEIGIINLAKISPKPSSEVLAVTKDSKKSEEPYSLDKYKKISSQSAIPLQTNKLKKSENGVNPFIVLGVLLISATTAFSVYSYDLFGLKSKLNEILKSFRN